MRSINPALKLSMDRSNKASSSSSNTVITNITLSRSPSESELKTNKEDDKRPKGLEDQRSEVDANPYANIEDLGGKTRDVRLNDTPNNMTDKDKDETIQFLSYLVEAFYNNPIKVNSYVICSVPLLEKLIETITGCDECDVQTEDFETSCSCSSKVKVIPVNKIWCRTGDSSEIFKYKYGQYMQIFERYHISLKLVSVEP